MTLHDFFIAHPRAAVAFSGGVDSAYLLCAAAKSGCDVHAYIARSPFQPAFELADAKALAAQLFIPLTVVETDPLADPRIRANPADRCYYCKQGIFSALWKAARADGYDLLLDGTNASDDQGDRPGMRALAELGVLSPLRMCGLTKEEIRRRSRENGLPTWDKPAYACLATRFPTGVELTAELLSRVERAESALAELGFTDFRVRLCRDGSAKLQLTAEQLHRAVAQRQAVTTALRPLFPAVLLDLEERPPSL